MRLFCEATVLPWRFHHHGPTMSGADTAAKPRYRFCWVCSRQLRGNFHRVCLVNGHEVITHANCADREKLEAIPNAHKKNHG